MMKIISAQIRSKSISKKHAKDIYFPVVQSKNNLNFPASKKIILSSEKNLRPNDPSQELKINQIEIQELRLSNNPQVSHSVLSPKKNNSFRFSQHFMMDRKSSHQSGRAKIVSTQKNWINKSAMYFTSRQKELFQRSFIEQEQKRKSLDRKMLEKKQSFESFKKMKQILKQEEKKDLLNDFQFNKQERERQKQIKQMQRKTQQRFIHEQNIAKIDMERYLKFQRKRQQLSLIRQNLYETQSHSEFLNIEKIKAKKIHLSLLESRLEFLKNEKIYQRTPQNCLSQRFSSRPIYKSGRKFIATKIVQQE